MKLKSDFDTENNLFIGLFDAMPFNVYVADIDSYELIFINRKLNESLNNSKNTKCYQSIYQLNSPCDHCPIDKLVNKQRQPTGDTVITELFNDVDDKWYQLQDKCIGWPDGRVAKYSIGVDITDQKKTQNLLAEAHAELALKAKDLELLSITDPLTKLFNRIKIDQVLNEESARCTRYPSPLSVIILDLDKFKAVNDTHGHLIGDQVLAITAETMRTNVRKHDYSARWGGEEFVIVCPETQFDEACLVAEKLRSQIESALFPEVGKITASFGVTSFNKGESVDTMLARADECLYEAKKQGRNKVFGRQHE